VQRQSQLNAQINAVEARVRQSLTGSQLAAAIAQLEAVRAQGNAQFAAAIVRCPGGGATPTSLTTTTTVSGSGTSSSPAAVPSQDACASQVQSRAQANAQIDATEARLRQSLTGSQLAAAIAQLEAARALGNSQFDAAIIGCRGATGV
jgi:hypothetical protein